MGGDSGNNVLIAQMLLSRSPYVNLGHLEINSKYDQNTKDAVIAFQVGNDLLAQDKKQDLLDREQKKWKKEMKIDEMEKEKEMKRGIETKMEKAMIGKVAESDIGSIDSITASKLLELHSLDHYVNSGKPAKAYNYLYGNYTYKYKIDIEVYSNRSIESLATLFDAENNQLYQFSVRLHGYRDDDVTYDRPDWSYDYGLNEFTTNGATPTGLFEIDLNSPEPSPEEYGPYPINRVVRGVDDQFSLAMVSDRKKRSSRS